VPTACGAKCLACTIPNFSPASTVDEAVCTECIPGLFVSTNGTCVDRCSDGTFADENGACTCKSPSLSFRGQTFLMGRLPLLSLQCRVHNLRWHSRILHHLSTWPFGIQWNLRPCMSHLNVCNTEYWYHRLSSMSRRLPLLLWSSLQSMPHLSLLFPTRFIQWEVFDGLPHPDPIHRHDYGSMQTMRRIVFELFRARSYRVSRMFEPYERFAIRRVRRSELHCFASWDERYGARTRSVSRRVGACSS
jgi:hypothetical protein